MEEITKHTLHEQDIIEKMILSIRKKFGRIVLRGAYEDILALFKKLKKKEPSPQHYYQEQYDQYFDDAPPIPPDSAELFENCSFEVHDCNEQVDFEGKGLVDNVYVPLLEKVCNIHPSLLECQRKRTYKYSGWALNALGRVLHFLETTKLEEMNVEACECLQMLWDEVQVFGFELSWLAPQVEFALNMEKLMREVEKLEEEKKSIFMRIQELRMKFKEQLYYLYI
ncbi:hypothetical protein Ahy_B04g070165 isoform A [Arachis hypogaea]|uniref:Uncharacterized protein n=1 Tax=Arachis hypogaea TaxID=3818 RepID=A0A444ZFI0_ARAHY|nr:hypothetical protein Ahy_B04g070165 isoform A [Arachis hypogaea]